MARAPVAIDRTWRGARGAHSEGKRARAGRRDRTGRGGDESAGTEARAWNAAPGRDGTFVGFLRASERTLRPAPRPAQFFPLFSSPYRAQEPPEGQRRGWRGGPAQIPRCAQGARKGRRETTAPRVTRPRPRQASGCGREEARIERRTGRAEKAAQEAEGTTTKGGPDGGRGKARRTRKMNESVGGERGGAQGGRWRVAAAPVKKGGSRSQRRSRPLPRTTKVEKGSVPLARGASERDRNGVCDASEGEEWSLAERKEKVGKGECKYSARKLPRVPRLGTHARRSRSRISSAMRGRGTKRASRANTRCRLRRGDEEAFESPSGKAQAARWKRQTKRNGAGVAAARRKRRRMPSCNANHAPARTARKGPALSEAWQGESFQTPAERERGAAERGRPRPFATSGS